MIFYAFKHRPLKRAMQHLAPKRRFNQCWHQSTSRELANNFMKTTNNERKPQPLQDILYFPKRHQPQQPAIYTIGAGGGVVRAAWRIYIYIYIL